MSLIPTSNISFRGLKTLYAATGINASGDNNLNDGNLTTPISLSFFRNANFTDGTSISGSGEISINSLKGKIFGTSLNILESSDFRAYSNWSTNGAYLIGTNTPANGQDNTGSTDITNKTIQLITPQNSIYSTILISPNSSSDTPGFSVDRSSSSAIDEATLWINLRSVIVGPSYGIIPLDTSLTGSTTKDKWNNQKAYIYNKNGNYHDRLAYNGGHFNFAGSRDDILSTTFIVNPKYRDGTYGNSLTKNFHNITGVSAGTMGSVNPGSLNTSYWFYTNTFSNFTDYNNVQGINLGFKVKWYETTLQCSLVKNSDIIQPISPPSTWSTGDLTDIFSGMYVSGTGIDSNDGAFIGEIHTNYMKLYKGKGVSQLTPSLATSDKSNVTLTISGYLYWVLGTSSDYTESPKIIGPPHTVLPKYQATGSTLSTISEVEEWAFYIGDSTNSNSNYFEFDIRHEEPSGTAFSYSVTYSLGTIPLPPELFSSFLEISNRVIDDSTAEDYNGNYDVSETEVPSGGYHHIYIGFKATSSQMYYSDICIAGVQVVDKDNNNKQIWIFNSGTTTDHVWKTKVGTVGIQTATGFPITPSTASSYGNSNYVSLDVNTLYDRASIATGTTSSNTGAADGISGSTTNLVVGNGTMSQSTGTYYVFRETSGTSSLILDSGVVMRSPEIELKQGDKIRVAHLVVSHPSYPQDEDDCLYLGVYPIDLTSKFVEISNRFIIDTTTADYTGNYDVSETQVHVSGNHNIYIGIKVTAPSPYTYYNDVAIAGVQIVNKDNQVKKTWIFNSVPSTSSTDQWQTYTNAVTGSSTPGFPITPQTASGYSYYNMIASASSTIRFSYATSTSSVNTGANDGIATTTNAFPLGDSVISQSSNTYYVYRETSGSTLWSGTVMRSPVYNFTSGDKIRVAHLVVGNSTYQMDPLDTLYLGVY